MKKYYLVTHEDFRGFWGQGTCSVVPHKSKKEAIKHTRSMCGKPKIYKLVEVIK